jgi:hypothetical protein
MERRTEKLADGYIDGQTDRQMFKGTEIQTDEKIDA